MQALPNRGVRLNDGTTIEGERAGQMSADDAAALTRDGYVRVIDGPDGVERKPAKRTAKKPAEPKRKPLTIEALDNGEGERG